MSVKRPSLADTKRCLYLPVFGELAPNRVTGLARCPVCHAWFQVTKRGTLRPHVAYRLGHENRAATAGEVAASAKRMVAKHRTSLDKLGRKGALPEGEA
jgi:hypothetical protein